MKLNEAMIWWNDRIEHLDYSAMPQVKVLQQGSPELGKYKYLCNSIGNCFGGWSGADPVKLAGHILLIYAKMVGEDGVDAKEARDELMKIDEYREWIEHETGPFAEVYWGWSKDH